MSGESNGLPPFNVGNLMGIGGYRINTRADSKRGHGLGPLLKFGDTLVPEHSHNVGKFLLRAKKGGLSDIW